MMRLLFPCLLTGLLFLAGCGKETPLPPLKSVKGSRVLVINEGNFRWNNASLDLYDPYSGELQPDVYRKANGKGIGDVLQSGLIINGTLWMVVNNSGRICGLDTATYKEKWSLGNVGSPRYLATSGSYVWVTDLYSGFIRVLKAADRSEVTRIRTGTWTEQILNDGTAMAVACHDGWMRRYDTLSFAIRDSVMIGSGLHWLARDKGGHTWALSAGNDSTLPALARFDPITKSVTVWELEGRKSAGSLCVSSTGDTVLYLSGGVYMMDTDAAAPPQKAFFNVPGANFYGLGCDPASGRIYVADAADYVSKGRVFVIDGAGALLRQFNAGIIPSAFLFY